MEAQEQFSILLVDDDLTIVRVLNSILSNFSPVRFADSGRLALKLARDSTPDLVLLDVDMPELNGFEVCKAFKADPALREVPIIFITGHENAQLEAKGIELGASDFISKPLHAPLVLARVRTYQRLKTLSETMRGAVKIDFLTGALTRRELEKALTQEWLRSKRSAAPLSLLLADIQSFAAYNTAHGDGKGDDCLRSVAAALVRWPDGPPTHWVATPAANLRCSCRIPMRRTRAMSLSAPSMWSANCDCRTQNRQDTTASRCPWPAPALRQHARPAQMPMPRPFQLI